MPACYGIRPKTLARDMAEFSDRIRLTRATAPCPVRIPLKAITIPERRRSRFRDETDQASERSDAGTSMLPRLIGIVKWNLSGAKRRKDGRGEDGGVGQGAAVPCPASAH